MYQIIYTMGGSSMKVDISVMKVRGGVQDLVVDVEVERGGTAGGAGLSLRARG